MGFVNIKCVRQKQKEKSSDFVMNELIIAFDYATKSASRQNQELN